jgi:O-antigen ligase
LRIHPEAITKGIDPLILFCLCVLVVFLPIAHTESIRAFALSIPVGLWLIKMIGQRHWVWLRTPVDLPILLFSIIGALSLVPAIDFRYSAREFLEEWVMGIVLLYLVIQNVQPRQIIYIFGALLLGNVIMVSYGIYDFFHHGGELFDYKIRAGSLHSGFGTFSTYLITIIPYLLIAVWVIQRPLWRGILLILLLGNFLSLYLTHARGAWLAAAVLLLLTAFTFFKRRILLLPLIFVLVVLGAWLPSSIFRHHTQINPQSAPASRIETGQARWELIKFSLEKIKENPFRMLGYGRRVFVKKFEEIFLRFKGAQLWHAHNTFLNIAFQTGL